MATAKPGADIVGAYAIALLLTVMALIADDSTVSWILAFPIVGSLVYTMAKQPLRVSLMWMMFCALTLENPSELPAWGAWQSPVYWIGALMLTHMNGAAGASFLFFSGMDLCLGIVVIIALLRKFNGSRIDRIDRVPTPQPLLRLAYVAIGAILFTYISGVIRGGDPTFARWQVDRVIYLPVVFLIFQMALRGPKDYAALAKVLLSAALVRASLAVYIMNTVSLPAGPDGNTDLPYATSHHDSILFASAVVLILALLIHRYPGAKRYAFFFLPVIMAGMIANNRRMVWVQVGIAFFTLYFATPMNPTKYRIRKVVWGMLPIAAIYIMLGWNHPTGFFSPVGMVRAVVEPGMDLSAQTREIENYDLISTLKLNPLFGVGYGNGYYQLIGLPPMGYDLEPYIPHNSILGLWAYCGYFGYTALTLLWSGGVYFAMRAYSAVTRADDRTAALTSYAAVLIYVVQCWGDMGLGSWTGTFLVAPALAMAGKLCVASGAWETKRRTKIQVTATPAAVGVAGAPPA
jgi:hypothetical protein